VWLARRRPATGDSGFDLNGIPGGEADSIWVCTDWTYPSFLALSVMLSGQPLRSPGMRYTISLVSLIASTRFLSGLHLAWSSSM